MVVAFFRTVINHWTLGVTKVFFASSVWYVFVSCVVWVQGDVSPYLDRARRDVTCVVVVVVVIFC